METDRLNDLNPIFLHKIRLGICVMLSETECITFSRFRELLEVSDGNLGAQLKKLREEGYVFTQEIHLVKKKGTWFSLTELGRRELKQHLDALEEIIRGSSGREDKWKG